MTKQEFYTQYQRLCLRFKFEPSDEQMKVWYERFGAAEAIVWSRAVDALVAEMRPPLLDHVLKAVDEAREQRRQAKVWREKQEASRFMVGRVDPVRYADSREEAYQRLRMSLLTSSIGQGLNVLAEAHASGLAGFLDDEAQARWANQDIIHGCGLHDGDHKLSACLVDEIRYWELRAQGQSEQDAKGAILSVTH